VSLLKANVNRTIIHIQKYIVIEHITVSQIKVHFIEWLKKYNDTHVPNDPSKPSPSLDARMPINRHCARLINEMNPDVHEPVVFFH